MATVPGSVLDETQAASLLPDRDPRGHKGTFGRVVMVVGSLDYAGAALMAGAAALRSGCGLVTLCVPASLQPTIAGRVPELITRPLPESTPGNVDGDAAAAEVLELPQDALLVGPGLRPGRGTTRLVKRLLKSDGPLTCVDAGALDVVAALPGHWAGLLREGVATPHPGEFERFGRAPGADDAERLEAATAAAEAWRRVLVLKGANTVIAGPDGRRLVASFELPALASAGSGDVLAGIITSLLAQSLEPFEAAALAVYLHGRAGEHVSERLGDAGLMATDLLAELPRIRRHLVRIRERAAGNPLGFEAPNGSPPNEPANDG